MTDAETNAQRQQEAYLRRMRQPDVAPHIMAVLSDRLAKVSGVMVVEHDEVALRHLQGRAQELKALLAMVGGTTS